MKRCSFLFVAGALVLLTFLNPIAFAQQGPANSFTSDSYSRPVKNLVDNIAVAPNRPILLELVLQAGILATLSAQTNYTFFAPTEEALKIIEHDNSDKLRLIVLHHVVPGKYRLDDLKDGAKLPTLAGDSITIFRKKKQILVNGIPVKKGNEMATNGVMHTINGILKPKNLE